MTEYIKREDAIKALGEEPYVWSDTDVEIAEHAQWVSDVKAIEAVPSADVVERKKGEWGYRWKIHGDGRRPTELFPCSECGYENTSATNFCPNCGADMRELK